MERMRKRSKCEAERPAERDMQLSKCEITRTSLIKIEHHKRSCQSGMAGLSNWAWSKGFWEGVNDDFKILSQE